MIIIWFAQIIIVTNAFCCTYKLANGDPQCTNAFVSEKECRQGHKEGTKAPRND